MSSIQFKDQDILKIINSFNYNKDQGYDDDDDDDDDDIYIYIYLFIYIYIIRLLKIWDSSIVKPLSIQTGTFPNNWKKSNVVPIHKKCDKQLLQDYF